jgi:hypothetical protein
VEYLGSSQKLDSPRKQRFPERFLEDIGRLVSLVTVEILSRQRRDGGESKVIVYFLTQFLCFVTTPIYFNRVLYL